MVGLVILFVGAAIYGTFCERIMKPNTNAKTPAFAKRDGVDFVPLNKWKNFLIELLNIAGTGPVFGPIQGALFGPIAFLTIPIGCVIAGAVHDYMVGMISLRNKGAQTPALVKKFLGGGICAVYNVIICLLLLLAGAIFIYTPGDLFVAQVVGEDISSLTPTIVTVYAAIFGYYFVATLFPIDKIIGRIYPIFGAILLLSAVGIFFGMFINGYPLKEIWETGVLNVNPFDEPFIPIFFITVACGIASGFHSTQTTIVSRTITNESHGRLVYYDTMITEGFIAMTWAAAAMGVLNLGLASAENLHNAVAVVVGIISKNLLGDIGGTIAVGGVIVLAITSGDTALRSLRMIIVDAFNIDNKNKIARSILALIIFAVVAVVLYFAKSDPSGFSWLWRYSSWVNEIILTFVFAMATVYMFQNNMPYKVALVPGTFYTYVVATYIFYAPIGFGFAWLLSCGLAAFVAAGYAILLVKFGKTLRSSKKLTVR